MAENRISKILVVELAGLGDNIHLIPMLWKLHRRWPDAELHVLVRSSVVSLFALAPWIAGAWPYRSSPKPGLFETLQIAAQLKKNNFDLVINTTGGDRATLIGWLINSGCYISRRPSDGGPIGWSILSDRVLEVAYKVEPMYAQKLRCAKAIGCEVSDAELKVPVFGVKVDCEQRRLAGVPAETDGQYIHISPFTSSPSRELPLQQLVDVVAAIRQAHPNLLVAISCSDDCREMRMMTRLLDMLPEPPWRVWSGSLDIRMLSSIVAGAAINLSGDTGSVHVALLTGAPAVAWFRPSESQLEWMPQLPQYRTVTARQTIRNDCLDGIETYSVVDSVKELLSQFPYKNRV